MTDKEMMEMTTKEWLNRGRLLNVQIDALIQERQVLFDMAIQSTRQEDGVRVQANGGNSSEAKIVKYAHYSVIIDKRIDELLQVKGEILCAINAVSNGTLRTLLQLRYINFYTWERIAEEMNMSDYWVRTRIHSRALAEIEKIQNEKKL